MPVLDPVTPAESLTIASTAVLFALLDALIEKGVFTKDEMRNILTAANRGVGARAQGIGGMGAMQLMGRLLVHFSERQV